MRPAQDIFLKNGAGHLPITDLCQKHIKGDLAMERNLKELINNMTLEEKAGMCSGLDFWHLKGVERLGMLLCNS